MAGRVIMDLDKRSETFASRAVLETCHQCLSMCIQRLLLWSSRLYLNQGTAKQKRDFPTRGQRRSPAYKSVGFVLASVIAGGLPNSVSIKGEFGQGAIGKLRDHVLAVSIGVEN